MTIPIAKSLFSLFIALGLLLSCTSQKPMDLPLLDELKGMEGLSGKAAYLTSPFVAAGDRVYMVGHQNGSFPDLGWHVEGEMGGIWNHPIKLMDGFTAAVDVGGQTYCLSQADEFINYPLANLMVYRSSVPGLEVERFQFVPDGVEGIVLEFSFLNTSKEAQKFNFEFAGHTDLMPVWLGERANMIDYEDVLEFDTKRGAWRGKDKGNDWFVLFGSNQPAKEKEGSSAFCNYQPQGKGVAGTLGYELSLKPQQKTHLRFFIAGSYQSQAAAEKNYELLSKHANTYLKDKRKHYEQIASKALVSIPDQDLQKAFEWIKYNTEWLVRDVPEIGRGLGAGMPDYPWWFGVDNEYTLKGAIATGRKDLVYATIDLIHELSKSNGNGRIVHEVSSNGVVFNPGNINETPQFASLIWWVYNWTGDRDFLAKYYPTVKKGLEWLMKENDKDGNLFPDGYGMMEIHGLQSEMIDVAVYTQKAFADASEMANEMGEFDLAKSYAYTATQLKEKINKEFWVEEFNGFADFIGTGAEALHLIDAAIVRADTLKKPWAVEELKATRKKIASYPAQKKRGFVVFHNWVVNTPMEMGIADSEKAVKALDKGWRFTNPFGVFVTGIDRDESSEMADGSFEGSKVFSYTGAVMTLPTGVSAIGENNYGRPDKALEYLKRMTRSFGFALPGSIYEVSPDYGMMAQAWNLYSFGVPIVTQFFGVQPMAHKKLIQLKPLLPSHWQDVSLSQVEVGDNVLSVKYQQSGDRMVVEVEQELGDWTIEFHSPKPFSKVMVNGKELQQKDVKGEKIFLSGNTNKVELVLF